ncbi:interleukin-7 receptor subunit alpha isoform X2 [Salminus brasiliensis]|uniref:interleukin-7 receptor subunit alpha isoform X2 n=1 Tax=Salminus brasiliensis TaxID=930266 RepID=UPI003B830F96
MAYVFWIFVTLCPFLAHSESGDDADAETSVAYCSSMISFMNNSLTCEVDDEDIDSIQYAKLCTREQCLNATLNKDSFRFDVKSAIGTSELRIYFRGGGVHKQEINLVKIVKIPVPSVQNATFKSDMVIININYKHDFVEKPIFQLEIWGANDTERKTMTVLYKQVTLGAHILKGNGIYYVRVRAKPEGTYFNGSWTAWSPVKKFSVSSLTEPPLVTYIILCTSVIVVIVSVLAVLRWKKEIQAYISPNIPNPKATLAHIHREKERPPVSFSPEIFNDININRVDYAEEKQLAPELEEDAGWSCSRPASPLEKQDGDDSSTRLEEEMSHLKIKLLDEPKEGENEVGCQSLASVQRDCRDETYVTMSSLYKTQ